MAAPAQAREELAPTPAPHHTTPFTRKSRSSVEPRASRPEDGGPCSAPAVSMFVRLHGWVRRQLRSGGSASEAEEKGSATGSPCAFRIPVRGPAEGPKPSHLSPRRGGCTWCPHPNLGVGAEGRGPPPARAFSPKAALEQDSVLPAAVLGSGSGRQ